MIYLIFGEQKLLINKLVDKITKESLVEINEFNFVVYDATKTPLFEIINDAESMSFLGDKKIIVIDNAYFLTGENVKVNFEQSFEELNRYLESPTESTVLIFTVTASKLDERKSLVKTLKEFAKVYALDSVSKYDLPKVVRQMFTQKKMSIDNDALKEFIARVGDDMYLISNEINKLSNYSDHITIDDVKALTSKTLEDNIYLIGDYLIEKNMAEVFNVYYDLKKMMVEPVNMISLLANHIRFLYQVFTLYNRDFNQNNIANELQAHPYRVKLALEKVDLISLEELENLLTKLASLDYKIKSGQIDRYVGFELFLVEACNKCE